MLQIKQLTITHKMDFRVILKDFSFVLNPGDKVVLIGEEGNGKSTLLKWIYDPELIEGYAAGRTDLYGRASGLSAPGTASGGERKDSL